MSNVGAVVGGRGTYDAAGAWGGRNPWEIPFFIVAHRTEEAPPPDAGFDFVGDLGTALGKAQAAAAGRDVHVMGGADIIRQALAAGAVDELTLIVAPVVLGGGKRLFDGSEGTVKLEQISAAQSDLVTYLTYRLVRG
jgi:dihydrofolate reductase